MKKISVIDHELVPEHIVLSERDVKSLLAKYHISVGELPKIKISDPVIKEIGASAGDVIKIIRNSHTAGKAIVYRLVID